MPSDSPKNPKPPAKPQQTQNPEAPSQAQPSTQKQNLVKPELPPIILFKESQDIDAKRDE